MAADQQLDLFSPDPERWPRKPYCSDDPASSGTVIRSLDSARKRAEIQANHPTILWRIPFDIDRPGAAIDWQDRFAPPPNLAIEREANRHAHLLYEIEIPVLRNGDTPAYRFAAAIEHGLGVVLNADRAYNGHLVHTPHHPAWYTQVFRRTYYDLTELAEYIPDHILHDSRWIDRRKRPPEDYALGRNVALFHTLRHWAYRAVRDFWQPGGETPWRRAVSSKAAEINGNFATPLPPQEVEHTAKSVAGWVWDRFTPSSLRELIDRTHTPELQRERGKKSGAARRAGSEAESRPWEALGISRATYYRRKGKSRA